MSWDQTTPSPRWQHGSGQAGPPPGAAGPYGPGQAGPPLGAAVPYGHGPAPTSLSGIAIAACILLGIAGLVCLGSAGTLFSRAEAAAAAADGDFGAFRALPQRDDSVALGTGLYVLAVLVAGPLVVVWQHRHASNAQRLSGPLGLGPGWAIGGWFIPLGNMVLPTVQLAQAGRASDPDLVPGPPGTRSRGRIPPITIVWGVAWALGGLLFSLGAVMRPSEDGPVLSADATLEDFATADRTAGVGMFVLAVAAILAIVMIRILTTRQARAEAIRPPFAGTAGPWAGGQPGSWAEQAGWGAPANPWAPPPAPGGQPGHLAPPPPPPPPPPPSGPGGPPPPPPPPGPPPDAWGPPR